MYLNELLIYTKDLILPFVVLYLALFFYMQYIRERKKNTLNQIKRNTFEYCSNTKVNVAEVVAKINASNEPDDYSKELREVINFFEVTAIGVNHGVLDEAIVYDCFGAFFDVYVKEFRYLDAHYGIDSSVAYYQLAKLMQNHEIRQKRGDAK